MSDYKYNSWPLGNLPSEWRRPEPSIIRDLGYNWEDPRDIIDIFEKKLAAFAGSKYAVLTDSCTNGLFLCLTLREIRGHVKIPKQTYVSVPMQIIHTGGAPNFEHIEWSGLYELGETGIFDSAARFTQGMFVGGGALQVLSFQIKKRLPIGRGGAILTDSLEEYKWLKLATYDGRDLKSRYESSEHVLGLGWHMYMTPEDAARGILLLDKVPRENPDTMTFEHYPDLTEYSFFKKIPFG